MCWDGKVITSSKPHVSLSSQHFPLIRIVCLKICLLHEFKLDVCYDQEWNINTSTNDVWVSLSLFVFRSLFLSPFGLGLFFTWGTPVQHKLFTVCTSVGIVVWLVKHCMLVGVCVCSCICVCLCQQWMAQQWRTLAHRKITDIILPGRCILAEHYYSLTHKHVRAYTSTQNYAHLSWLSDVKAD
jgi:hypothetical protein